MSCLVRRALGQRAMDHGRQEYHHTMWEGQEKNQKGQGLAWYEPYTGEKPSSPRSRASSGRATLLLADGPGGQAGSSRECCHHLFVRGLAVRQSGWSSK